MQRRRVTHACSRRCRKPRLYVPATEKYAWQYTWTVLAIPERPFPGTENKIVPRSADEANALSHSRLFARFQLVRARDVARVRNIRRPAEAPAPSGSEIYATLARVS